MCNHIHRKHTVPAQTFGYGWKIFSAAFSGKLIGMVSRANYVRENMNSDWAEWSPVHVDEWYGDSGDGFCVIPTWVEANRLLEDWTYDRDPNLYKIVKVEYQDAVALQLEDNILIGNEYETLIVKKFRPVGGWNVH
jgi:hypothetical protein